VAKARKGTPSIVAKALGGFLVKCCRYCYLLKGGLPGLNAPDDFMHDARQAPPHVDDSRSLSSTDPDGTKAPAQLNQDSEPLSCTRTCLKDLDSRSPREPLYWPKNSRIHRSSSHPQLTGFSSAVFQLNLHRAAEPQSTTRYLPCLRA
jgi:hypothetical protein